VEFPDDCHITYTANHWANDAYIENTYIPYVKKERQSLRFSDDHSALVFFDIFKGQCTEKVLKLLEDNNILYVTVPGNCTDRLQPLDQRISQQDFLRSKFQEWYGIEICKQL